MKNNNIIKEVQLASNDMEFIIRRLQRLVLTNPNVSELAYAGQVNAVASCSCEKGCEGCTSW